MYSVEVNHIENPEEHDELNLEDNFIEAQEYHDPLNPDDEIIGLQEYHEKLHPEDDLDAFEAVSEMLGDDYEDELDDEDEEDWEEEPEFNYLKPVAESSQLQVLPLSSAAFPRTCYLVIDRSAELITRPLKEFADLGRIPVTEVQQKTLPVFDNHRVARRFSKRRERVIKIPDGRLIQKAGPYLEAKGITRLLLDGQIYALSVNV